MPTARLAIALAMALAVACAAPAAALAAADLSVGSLGASPEIAPRGEALSYSLRLRNSGPGTARDVALSLAWDPNRFEGSSISVSNVAGQLPACDLDLAAGRATCRWGSVSPGSDFRVALGGLGRLEGLARIDASVSSSTSDPDAGDASGSVHARVTSLEPSAAAIDFGSLPVGSLSGGRRLTLTNSWREPVEVTRLDVTGRAGADFLTSSDRCTRRVLAVGEDCDVDVRFRPGAGGSREATLVVSTDRPEGQVSSPRVELRGFGHDAGRDSGGAAPPRPGDDDDAGPGAPSAPRDTVPGGSDPFDTVGGAGPRADLLVVPVRTRLAARTGRRAGFEFVASARCRVAFEVRRGRRVVLRMRGSAARGRNRIRWRATHRGRRGRALRPGRYTIRLRARRSGRLSVVHARVRVLRLRRSR